MKIDIEKLHNVQLNLLKEFKRVCDEHGILFYPFFGSLIGAVRHNGFIPWDDDIDVIVKYSDYVKLIENGDRWFKYPYFFQCTSSDKYFNKACGRLRKSDTTLITKDSIDKDINQGVSIDVYPAIKLADNRKKRVKQQFFTKVYLLTHVNAKTRNHGKLLGFLTGAFVKIIPEKLKKRLERYSFSLVTAYENDKAKEFYILTGGMENIYLNYDCEIFNNSLLHIFEDLELLIPKDYDAILKRDYGKYMEFPPLEEQGCKLDTFLFFDPDNSYEMYKGKKYCIQSEKK